MKVVIQRVDSSSVKVNMDEISSIDNGLLILWGVEVGDTIEDVNILTEKIGIQVNSSGFDKFDGGWDPVLFRRCV